MSKKLESSANPYLCTAAIGSMTGAMKAQKALSAAAIRSSVVKLASSAHRGCSYGVSFPCAQQNNVRLILENAGVKIRGFM